MLRGCRRPKTQLAVTCAVLLAAFAVGVWLLRPAPRINVLLITLDTTRADRIGCYGHQSARTTAIDALSEAGVTFDNAYVTVPLTLPSHASMLTGLYPAENGLHNNGEGRLGDVPTLAGILKENDYRTAAFIGAVVLHAKGGLDRGFDVYDDDMAGGERHGDETHLMRSGRMVVDAALDWLRGNEDAPYFAGSTCLTRTPPTTPTPRSLLIDSCSSLTTAISPSQMCRLKGSWNICVRPSRSTIR